MLAQGEIHDAVQSQVTELASTTDLQIIDALTTTGLLIFSFDDPQEVYERAQMLGAPERHPDSPETDFTTIRSTDSFDNGKTHEQKVVQRVYTSDDLVLHTDRAIADNPPEFLILLCTKPPQIGGASIFADGMQLYKYFQHHHPTYLELLKSRDAIYHRLNNQFNAVPVFEELADNRIRIRARLDGLLYANSDLWEPMTTLKNAINRFSVHYYLNRNEGYIIQNTRWLHGRTRFHGSRECMRLLVSADRSNGQQFSGFVP